MSKETQVPEGLQMAYVKAYMWLRVEESIQSVGMTSLMKDQIVRKDIVQDRRGVPTVEQNRLRYYRAVKQ